MLKQESKKWFIKAMNDYKTAEKLINLPPNEIITDTLCFHCEQFVEKALKSFLVLKNIEFKKTHDLEYLIKLCSDVDKSFEVLYEASKILSVYSVEIRYPDEFYEPTIEEAKEAYKIAVKVKEFVLKKVKL